jgi:uncharacterized membrane protein (UPF0136 family)
MVKVLNNEEYEEWREPKVGFLRKRDKVQFLVGCAVFTLGAVITIAAVLECVESITLGFLVAMAGAIVLLTSRLCMRA